MESKDREVWEATREWMVCRGRLRLQSGALPNNMQLARHWAPANLQRPPGMAIKATATNTHTAPKGCGEKPVCLCFLDSLGVSGKAFSYALKREARFPYCWAKNPNQPLLRAGAWA